MKKTIILLLVWVLPVFAEGIVVYDTTTNVVKSFRYGDPSLVTGRTDVLVFNETELPIILDLISRNIPLRFWLVQTNVIREMTQAEKDSVDLSFAIADTLRTRESAKSSLDGFSNIYERAKLDIIKEEINILRARDRDRAQDVADATSLADLKVRWAARSALSDRTLQQFKTKVKNKIDDKSIDISVLSKAPSLNEGDKNLPNCGGGLFIPFLLGVWLWLRKLLH